MEDDIKIGPSYPVVEGINLEDKKVKDKIEKGIKKPSAKDKLGKGEASGEIEALKLNKLEYYREKIDIS